jgi:hypothetical protein
VVDPADRQPPSDLLQRLTAQIESGQRAAAVRYFMVDGMGAPSVVPALLRLMPGAWKALMAVAAALPDGRLVQRRGLGHTKALNAAEITVTLTDFLTSADNIVRAGGSRA